ncbi:LysR family transcriptional regulator (plasmid) [Paracoccus versutus]|uniref:DNA-binding transcriptional LysR family regulator n=1 Tax=Paracoccus versutus TaxID=34007 RepID=A0AAQ0HGN9_PARVE|nr:LysR family transcriptional regulator [Paracoccus versutus]KGJ11106.1 LysR family transcriptional regulator [Paracoccus versutus]REG45743.1 DNA-binding transcriptional LysR family regulator [Paracoccus versutus]WEJ80730.1 LysR family transcriptional regulator [Paracoccus versutus]
MRFDLTDLRLFLAVADAGSITHGAADAGLSLPAASERLRDMELAGGVRLLERGRRGVTLTEAGEALAHHARLISRQMAMMRGELGEYATGLRSTVRLLSNTAAIAELLPQRLAAWMAANPRIDLDLKERQSIEIARSVMAGFADIGILSAAAAQEGLELRPFAEDLLVVVAAQDDALARMRQVRLADLAGRHFIGLSGSALQDHIAAQAAAMGMQLRYRVRLRTFDGICRMAGAGAGIGIVPRTAARRMKRTSGIAIIRLADGWALRRLSVCIRAGTELSAPAQSLFRHLTQGTPAA